MSATESASVFEVASSYERSAHAQVCSVSLEPSATSLTDPTENLNNDQQAPRSPHNKETIERKAQKSLEAVSVESTLLDVASETRQDTLLNISTQIVDRSQDQAAIGEETQVDHDNVEHEDPDYEGHDNGHATETVHPEHLPEPPASPVSNTLLSTPSNSTYEDSGVNGTKESKPRVPSANRISISYAGGNRRLVIDAEVVRSMKVLRQVGMIEVVMDMIKFNETDLKGILVGVPILDICLFRST
jgi:20S proteasome subunit alpha 6